MTKYWMHDVHPKLRPEVTYRVTGRDGERSYETLEEAVAEAERLLDRYDDLDRVAVFRVEEWMDKVVAR